MESTGSFPQASILLEETTAGIRISRHLDERYRAITRIQVVGAPDWDQLVSASLAYNRAAPSRLTLWDFTGGTFPEVDAVLARFVADRVAPHLSDASDRKVAMLALGDHEFAQLRVYASWAEIHLQASIRMQFRPFRSVGPAIDWLLSP